MNLEQSLTFIFCAFVCLIISAYSLGRTIEGKAHPPRKILLMPDMQSTDKFFIEYTEDSCGAEVIVYQRGDVMGRFPIAGRKVWELRR